MSFTTQMKVRIGDVNYGGHVGNDHFLLYFHEGRLRFLESFGFSELDIGQGVSLIMSEAHVFYKSQLRYGDDIEINVTVSDIGKVRFKMNYEITNKHTGILAAEGYTMMSGFDYVKNKLSRLPQKFISIAVG